MYNNWQYYYYNPSGGMTWAAAEAYCVSEYGGHLASFHSTIEYTAVMAGLEDLHGTVPYGWIGLKDSSSVTEGGTVVWSDGSAVDWLNWGGLNKEWSGASCNVATTPQLPLGAVCKRSGTTLQRLLRHRFCYH